MCACVYATITSVSVNIYLWNQNMTLGKKHGIVSRYMFDMKLFCLVQLAFNVEGWLKLRSLLFWTIKWVSINNTVCLFSSECRLNPTPGVCRESERRLYWTFSQKTGTCVQLIGCYTIRDRNVWLTRPMCRNYCIKPEIEPRSSVLPNFLYENGKPVEAGFRRGRRGRIMTRNTNPGNGNQGGGEIIVSDIITTIDVSATNMPNRSVPPLRGSPSNRMNIRPTVNRRP